MSLGESINQDSTPPSSSIRHFLIVPSFNPERRHSWANVISYISARNSDITSSINVTNAEATRSFSSINIRSFPFQCCGERRNSSQRQPVEQISKNNFTHRKSSTPSISSRRPSKNLIRNHRKTNTKPAIISSSITIPTLTKSTKKRRRRGGMASACTSCVSSNHSRRPSSTTLDDITAIPAISSSTNPPLLTRLGQIILRRRTTGGTNNSTSSTIVNNKSR
ncbi:unnamed protein product [Rotaria sp. Silwood2]|nr:unnamed protein product [Rotaria sp. Silwood2]CAF3972639.1 unnamed protein product [Rotaria sp. Silwood2]